MALAMSEVRGIVERACARQDVLAACAKRDLGTVITVLNAHGLTQGQIAELTGILQGTAERVCAAQAHAEGLHYFAAASGDRDGPVITAGRLPAP